MPESIQRWHATTLRAVAQQLHDAGLKLRAESCMYLVITGLVPSVEAVIAGFASGDLRITPERIEVGPDRGLVTHGNYSFREPPLRNGDVIVAGNFSQLLPGTEICASVSEIMIHGGNFVNVKKQPTWSRNGGNWAQISRCSHQHPDWVAKGLIECPEECEHLTDTDTVTIDGQEAVVGRHYEDKVVT